MKVSHNNIPRLPHAFFKWYCKKDRYEELHGDLEEYFYERIEEKGIRKARWLYLLDVLKCCQPYAWKTPGSQTNSNIGMLKNYYFTTIRNLLRHKSYFLINVSGLAIGIASFIFIALYVMNELTYDQFHSKSKNIYRVCNEAIIRGKPNNSATSSGPMARTLLAEYPEVMNATRLIRVSSLLIGKDGDKFNEDDVLFSDPALFEVFDFKLLKGDPQTALKHSRSMILSERYAKKYFGNDDPIGQKLTVDEDSIFYTITGVFENIPANSHIKFDMMGSISSRKVWNQDRWVGGDFHTYVVLPEDVDIAALEAKMKAIFYKYMAPEIEYWTGLKIGEWESADNSVTYALRPIEKIHLYSESQRELEPGGNITYIYIYGIIGIIILCIAIFNFVNLATAHSATRAKEVGVRKVIGSTKQSLIYQFIFESVLIAMMSTILGVLIVSGFMPLVSDSIGISIAYELVLNSWGILFLLVLGLMVGIFAGFYPAFVLSTFKPVDVLKGTLKAGAKHSWLRNMLVTIQFTASIVIIVGTLVIYDQINYMLTKNLGFEKDQVFVLKRPDWLNNNLEVFKQELLRMPVVKSVANSETIPGKQYEIRSYRPKDDPATFLFLNNQVSYEYMNLMNLELIAGRNFSRSFGADSNAVIINESAAKALGYDDPIGKPLTSAFKKDRPLQIIGVIKDYHIESLHKVVAPVSIELDDKTQVGYVSVKLKSDENIRETVAQIEDLWGEYTNGKPMQSFFFNQDYENLYKSESTSGKILIVFATLSIFIACMGLIGLITYTATVRKKEIGIRKVLGASVLHVIKLLSGETAKLIALSTVISWPLAYLATDYWLQNFADRITFNVWLYIGSTALLVIVVCCSISFQTFKASSSNPVDSLRQE